MLLLEQPPLRFTEPEVVMRVMAGDAVACGGAKLLVLGRREDDERRQQLLEHVTVPLPHEPEETLRVMRDEVDVRWAGQHRLDRIFAADQAEDFARRKDVHAADVEIRIGRRKAVEMRAADRREEERMRM